MRQREPGGSTSPRQKIDARITQFLAANFPLAGDIESLDPNASLLDAGVIDSTGVLELLSFIEGEFGFTVPDEDLVPENFASIDAIGTYIAGRA